MKRTERIGFQKALSDEEFDDAFLVRDRFIEFGELEMADLWTRNHDAFLRRLDTGADAFFGSMRGGNNAHDIDI